MNGLSFAMNGHPNSHERSDFGNERDRGGSEGALVGANWDISHRDGGSCSENRTRVVEMTPNRLQHVQVLLEASRCPTAISEQE